MKQEKVTFIHSISAKITLLAVFIVVVSLVGSVINASSKSRKVVENVNSNYILSLAEMGAQTIGNIPADIAIKGGQVTAQLIIHVSKAEILGIKDGSF